jgi:flagellar L-ring protein FlgH
MRMTLQIGLTLAALAVIGGRENAANAQSAPAPAAQSQFPRRSSGSLDPATPPPSIGLLMERAGGSLARAELAYRSDGSSPTAAMASYYSVPEPPPKLLHTHDLVTIVIREDSNFSSQGTTDLKRTADIDAQITNYLQLKLAPLSLLPRAPVNPLEIKGNTSRDFKGDATVDRTDSLTANITATVVDVKPNGTLVLQATKSIKTDDEEQQFVLTGTCRVDDITADNTVLSTQMYGLELTKMHKGAVRDTTNRSIIHRFLDIFNPF